MKLINLRNFVAQPIVGSQTEFLSIDLLRGVSALSILIFHFHHFAMGGERLGISQSQIDSITILIWLSSVTHHGGVAVMLFWMISGFVFFNVYAGREDTNSRKFFMNRFSRLYPLHFITLITVAIIQFASFNASGEYLIYQYNDFYHFVLNLLFASEWGFQLGRSFNGPIWSVSVEVIVYALFFVYLKIAPQNRFSLITAFVISSVSFYIIPGNTIVLCTIFFFGGAGIYSVYRLVPSECSIGASLAAAIIAAGIVYIFIYHAPKSIPLTFWLLIIFGLLILCLALLEGVGLKPIFAKAKWIGDVTYSSYLWHSPLQMAFLLGAIFNLWSAKIILSSWFVIAYVIFVCAFSYISYKVIEKPMQKLIRNKLSS